jgi:hypothetical protein
VLSLGVPEREVESCLRPVLTLDKRRIGGESGPDLSPLPDRVDGGGGGGESALSMTPTLSGPDLSPLPDRVDGGGGGGESALSMTPTLRVC